MDREEFVLVRDMVRSLATRFGVTSADEVKPSTRATAQQALDELGLTDLRRTSPPAATAQECALLAEEHGRHPLTTSLLGTVLLAPELLRLLGTNAPGTTPTIALTRELRFPGRTSTDLVAWDCDGADSALCVTAEGALTWVELGPPAPSTDLVRSVRAVPPNGPTEVAGHLTAPDQLRWQAYALVVVSAEIVGAAGSLVEQSVEYARVRHQYGRPIGSFQAVQHLLADATVLVEACTSVTRYAAWCLDNESPERALTAARVAKAEVNSSALEAVYAAMQVFGGIAQTWEHVAHLYLRKVRLGSTLLATTAELLPALAVPEAMR
ncbi:acyl-CoA dehydrogenase family protein [Streptomyces sp. NBC_00696]|uniref:acyl-CoA dehydrogenase family protein n=1 Tax=Streptomyces sp. NBC_00696 TaxID=2903672 RepID=UPI002E2F2C15|nr:acyl-CoA dehydrogenase family protein [Streptomyces sp. NBC_00696]